MRVALVVEIEVENPDAFHRLLFPGATSPDGQDCEPPYSVADEFTDEASNRIYLLAEVVNNLYEAGIIVVDISLVREEALNRLRGWSSTDLPEDRVEQDRVEQKRAEAEYPNHHPETALANYRAGNEARDTNGDLW